MDDETTIRDRAERLFNNLDRDTLLEMAKEMYVREQLANVASN